MLKSTRRPKRGEGAEGGKDPAAESLELGNTEYLADIVDGCAGAAHDLGHQFIRISKALEGGNSLRELRECLSIAHVKNVEVQDAVDAKMEEMSRIIEEERRKREEARKLRSGFGNSLVHEMGLMRERITALEKDLEAEQEITSRTEEIIREYVARSEKVASKLEPLHDYIKREGDIKVKRRFVSAWRFFTSKEQLHVVKTKLMGDGQLLEHHRRSRKKKAEQWLRSIRIITSNQLIRRCFDTLQAGIPEGQCRRKLAEMQKACDERIAVLEADVARLGGGHEEIVARLKATSHKLEARETELKEKKQELKETKELCEKVTEEKQLLAEEFEGTKEELKNTEARAQKAEESVVKLEEWKVEAEEKIEEGERKLEELTMKHTATCGKLDVERRRVRELTLLIEEGEESEDEMDDEDEGPAYLRDAGPRASGPKMVVLGDGTKVVKPQQKKERLRMAREECEAAKEQTKLISAAVIDRELRMEMKNADLHEMLRQQFNLIRHLKRNNEFLEENVEEMNAEISALKAAGGAQRRAGGGLDSTDKPGMTVSSGGFLPMASTVAPSTAGRWGASTASSDQRSGFLAADAAETSYEMRSDLRSQELYSVEEEDGADAEAFWDLAFEPRQQRNSSRSQTPCLPWQRQSSPPAVVILSPGRQEQAMSSSGSSFRNKKPNRTQLSPLAHAKQSMQVWR